MNINWSSVFEGTIASLLGATIIGIIGYFKSTKFKSFINLITRPLITLIMKYWRFFLSILLITLFEAILFHYGKSWELLFFTIFYFFITIGTIILFTYKKKTNGLVFDYNFSDPQRSILPQGAWQPNIDQRGIEIIPHEKLTRFLTLPDFNLFSNGIIECEVNLNHGALINVMLRGSFGPQDIFYMARLDSRDNFYDCILIKRGQAGWSVCNDKNNLLYHSPSNQWVRLKISLKNAKIHLFRDGKLVDKISNMQNLSGGIGFFAERGNVYLRRVKINTAHLRL